MWTLATIKTELSREVLPFTPFHDPRLPTVTNVGQ